MFLHDLVIQSAQLRPKSSPLMSLQNYKIDIYTIYIRLERKKRIRVIYTPNQ